MTPILFLLGPSDDASQNPSTSERVAGGTKVTVNMSGLLPILPYIASDPDLSAKSEGEGKLKRVVIMPRKEK